MQHRGEIVKKAVHQSGYSVTKLAQKLGKSRRWMYQMFENNNVSLEVIIKIGTIINYDFSSEIPMLKNSFKEVPTHSYNNLPENTVDYWKNKYLVLLEEYNQLLKSLDQAK